MFSLLLSLALTPLAVSADTPLAAGTQWNFRGAIAPQDDTRKDVGGKPDTGKGGKTFDVTLWITQKSENGAEVFWLVDEQGRGTFPWSEHFGKVSLDSHWRTAAPGPAVLYDRGEGRSVVPIPLPFLTSEKPLAVGTTFAEGKFEFSVDKVSKVDAGPAWQVNVRDPFGPKRRLLVDQKSPLVLRTTEKVVMGRGEDYQLTLEFIGSEQLSGDPLSNIARLIEQLAGLRGKLNLPARSEDVHWKKEQLDLLSEQLPGLITPAAGTPLATLLTAAQRDLQLQSGRSTAVADLNSKFEGSKVEEFSLKGLGGDALSLAALDGRVTVLHFWDYRDEPLKEPYGQVGYLEFMYNRRKADGLQLYGVAVDGRLGDEKTRSAAERSVRKLKEFMNLSYPLLLDAGGLVKQFGDPRVVGANLPLFVVIGPDHKIIHYHVGHYDVHQDQGLKELDQVVGKALEKK